MSFRTLLAVAVVLTPALAEARPFGEKSQYIVTTDAKFDYQRDTARFAGDEDTHTIYAFKLAGDYSSFRRVTFGVEFALEGEVEGFDTEKGFRFGGRAGYIVTLGPSASLWLRAGASSGNVTVQNAMAEYTLRTTRVSASAPVMFHPYPQVLIGLGPTFDHELSAKVANNIEVNTVTGFGVHMTLGFWFE